MKMKILFLAASWLVLQASVLLGAAPQKPRADEPPPADIVPFAGLGPQEACDKATLPPGFKMHVFAAEPDLVQPIAFCLDHRGRAWVAEGLTYPRRRGNPPPDNRPAGSELSQPTPEQLKDIFGGADRILIFEDTDGDHHFDKKTVFLEHLNLVSGLEVGFGGVWVGAAPYLLFIPVQDWESPKPAGDPRILLDGWNYTADTHEVLNTFTWGPDGWLYGCHGVFCPSHVGKPGAPESDRQWMDAGVWRYQPIKHTFEVFTEGGSNPWGIDFDENGQLWAEMCVIPHLWHMIQGARIERQGGEHFCINHEETLRNEKYRDKNSRKPIYPFVYDDIKQHGDHVHWAGNAGPHAANARSDAAGGGHAHAGVMSYLGDSWPAVYRGQLFIGNIHGQRLNVDIPERAGSGYVGHHGKDFLNFNDSWSQTLNQRYDQDGSVYIIDWYDQNQCHHTREDGHDRSNGRLYKIVYKDQKTTPVDITKLSDAQLAALVPSSNEWMSRHARLVLQERFGKLREEIPPNITELSKAPNANQNPLVQRAVKAMEREGAVWERLMQSRQASTNAAQRLRILWTLHVMQDHQGMADWLQDEDEYVRGWAVQLLAETGDIPGASLHDPKGGRGQPAPPADTLYKMAVLDRSPVVRRFIASALQRFDPVHRWDTYAALLRHSEDATDHNLPLMVWFAGESLLALEPARALALAVETKLPRILNFTARRIAALGTGEALNLVSTTLSQVSETKAQLEILNGLAAALRGQRSVSMPAGWTNIEAKLGASPDADVRTLVESLSLTFGSQNALASLRKTLVDKSAPTPARRAALDSLSFAKDPELPGTLQSLLRDPELRGAAIRALASYNDPKTPGAILTIYTMLDGTQKRDALNTLVSRPNSAKPLLAAVAAGSVPQRDLTADVVRQLRNLKDQDIQQQVTKLYGSVRETSADKKAEIERYRRIYWAGGSQPGNAYSGRVVFNKVCAQCHTLFDSGGKVGPDITGSNRGDLNYLLENMLDPNAVIPNEYRTSEIETKDGRSLTGIIKSQDDKSLVVQTANERLTLPRSDIASQRQTELSMMPEGLLAQLTDQEVRDLIYYLGRLGQVPLPTERAAK